MSARASAPAAGEGELLALAARFERAWARELALQRAKDPRFGDAVEATKTLAEAMADRRAVSLDGLVAKARAVSWFHCGRELDADAFGPLSADGAVAASIVRDLLSIARGGLKAGSRSPRIARPTRLALFCKSQRELTIEDGSPRSPFSRNRDRPT